MKPLARRYRQEQEKVHEMLEPARQALGEAVTAAVEAEGRAMSLEQAIEEALQTR